MNSIKLYFDEIRRHGSYKSFITPYKHSILDYLNNTRKPENWYLLIGYKKIPAYKTYYSPIFGSIYNKFEAFNVLTYETNASKSAAYTLRNNTINDFNLWSTYKRVFETSVSAN